MSRSIRMCVFWIFSRGENANSILVFGHVTLRACIHDRISYRVPRPNLGQSTANDVSALTNFICPVRHRNFVPKIESIHVNTVFTVSNPPLLESWPQKVALNPQVQSHHPALAVFLIQIPICVVMVSHADVICCALTYSRFIPYKGDSFT